MTVDTTGTNKERYDKTIRRKEKLAGYFYDMSKIVFTATVIANIGGLINGISLDLVVSFLFGMMTTIVLAWWANRIMIY